VKAGASLPPQSLLRVVSLSKSFGTGWFGARSRVLAVADVSFELRQGEVVGLIGGSGSGKTTITRLIMGLEQPDGGQIFFQEQGLTGLPWRERMRVNRQLHLVFQDPYDSLAGGMRVRKIVAEPLMICSQIPRERRDRVVLEALEEVGLTPAIQFAQRYPRELSGGQRQRVALARALVLRPRLIIADEPTSMLDVSVRAGIIQLMRELRDRHGLSYLFITHDLALARHFCNRLVVLQAGRIVEEGPTSG
jgi:ABC-type glutathione transport system ATPase component